MYVYAHIFTCVCDRIGVCSQAPIRILCKYFFVTHMQVLQTIYKYIKYIYALPHAITSILGNYIHTNIEQWQL